MSGLAKVRQLWPIFLLLFCVLQQLMLASLLCHNCLSELLFSRLVFQLQVLTASTSLISLPLPLSPSVIVFAFAISSASITLLSPSSSSTPSTSSLLPSSLLNSAAHLHCHLSLSCCHHLVLSTPQDTSQRRCQYTDIYASPIFIIRTFLLVGDMASSPILSLTSLGTFLNLHVDADSTLQWVLEDPPKLQPSYCLIRPQPGYRG